MKQFRCLLLITSLFCINSSCKKDFLEVVDKTVLLKQGYVIDLATTGHYLNGIYNMLAQDYVNGGYMPYPEITADNMKTTRSDEFVQAYNWRFQSTSLSGKGEPINMWTKYYAIIRSCNYVIEKADTYRSQDETKANSFKGQALAIRAMVHFTLCNMFAQAYNFTADASHPGIPYITSSDIETPVSRQTVKEVYSLMIQDLTTALALLPDTVSFTRELLNHQAAKALLARIYLFKEDYTAAKNICRQVLTSAPILTASDYPAKQYTAADNEALFRMPPGANASANYYGVFIGYYSSLAGGELIYTATNDIAKILRENVADKRANWVKDTLGTWQIRKFPKKVTSTFPLADGDYYQSVIRSSEICLTAAEAYAKLNMEDSARHYTDAIRQRANPSLANLTATGPALLDTIYKERRKEMCFDGLRMWDLKRWKMGVQRMDSNNPNALSLPYPSNKSVAAIPRTDVELNNLQQNPGYQ